MILDLSEEHDKQAYKDYCNKLLNKSAKVEIKEIKNKRTLSQNAYLHVIITLYAIEIGFTIEEAKTNLKRQCNFMTYIKNDMPYLKRTRDLDTKQLTEFIDWIRNYAGQIGIYLPSPEGYLISKYQIDKEIDRHKEFL